MDLEILNWTRTTHKIQPNFRTTINRKTLIKLNLILAALFKKPKFSDAKKKTLRILKI